MHLLLLYPVTNQTKAEMEQRVDRVILLLDAEAE